MKVVYKAGWGLCEDLSSCFELQHLQISKPCMWKLEGFIIGSPACFKKGTFMWNLEVWRMDPYVELWKFEHFQSGTCMRNPKAIISETFFSRKEPAYGTLKVSNFLRVEPWKCESFISGSLNWMLAPPSSIEGVFGIFLALPWGFLGFLLAAKACTGAHSAHSGLPAGESTFLCLLRLQGDSVRRFFLWGPKSFRWKPFKTRFSDGQNQFFRVF